MKAIVQDRYGNADSLALRDIDTPVVGDDDVLVRVGAAGCGPDVWHLMSGKPYLGRLGLGLRRPKFPVLGWDLAGTIEAVGRNVAGLAPGDEVMGTAKGGAFAEFAVTSSENVVRKPVRLTLEQAAAIPISGTTALRALTNVAKVQAGQSVLVIGAAGGVGSLAVQIAKALGATVTGVCSTSKLELVRSIGADDTIDYTRDDFAGHDRPWDVIIDTAGRRPLSQLRRALTRNGVLVIVGGDGGGAWTGGFFRGVLRAPIVSLFVRQRLRGLVVAVKKDDLVALARLVDAGQVTPVVDRTFSLTDTASAIRYLEQGHPAGKVVISPMG